MKKRTILLTLAAMLTLSGCGESSSNDNGSVEDTTEKESKTLVGLEIVTKPTKTTYKEGEVFDPSGMVVKAKYSDDTNEVITKYTFSDEELTLEDTKVTISYKNKTVDVSISVTPVAKYTITFMANETDKIEDVVYKEGQIPNHECSKESNSEYEFHFLGWALSFDGTPLDVLPEVTQDATYYAIFEKIERKYLVTFKDENGEFISSSNLRYGATIDAPEYEPNDTIEFDYEFEGWSLTKGGEVVPTIPNVSGDVTYYAVVSSSTKSYLITFIDINGTVVQSSNVLYGETPSCDYEVSDTQEWDYTTGWSLTVGGEVLSSLPKVTKAATYYAVTSQVKQKYFAIFKNEDGSSYTSQYLEYGSVPSVSNPTKQSTKQYTYSFEGWSLSKGGSVLPSIPAVTGNAIYYAVFKSTVNKYTVTFKMNFESNDQSLSAEYGTSYNDFDDYIPTREGYHFAGWCLDEACQNKISFPYVLSENVTLYAKWNEKVDVAGYFKSLVSATQYSPYSFIPETLTPTYEDNFIEASDVLNFSTSKSVSSIKRQGFGEQWQMVIDNMNQSQKFYSVISASNTIFSAATGAFISFFESNQTETSHEDTSDNRFSANASFSNGVLTFSVAFKESISIPVLGSFKPVISIAYDVLTGEKIIKVELSETNVMKCSITDNSYVFGIEYGVDKVNRSAYCQLNKIVNPDDEEDITYEGHIYEYISTEKDEETKDLVSSAADFYIDDKYCSVVGNKADGILLMDSYINELYDVETGYLLGYKVMETKTLFGFTGTYNTLWFNLGDITGITSVSFLKKAKMSEAGMNEYNVYLNGSADLFEVKRNSKVFVPTSRKYDVEPRKHYYYGADNTQYMSEIPMMFIQDGDNFKDFTTDMNKTSGISNASVILASEHLEKIRDDYETLIPIFQENKDNVTSDTIKDWLK